MKNKEYPTIDGIPQYPTNPTRLFHLDTITKQLYDKKGKLEILEIGSLYGHSALILGRYGHVICIDTWSYENGKQGLKTFLDNTKGLDLTVIKSKSCNVLEKFKMNTFDLIYIDGDHRYSAVYDDIAECMRLSNGIICGDDYEKPLLNAEDVLEALKLKEVDYINGYHPGVSLAIYELLDKVNMKDGFWWVEL